MAEAQLTQHFEEAAGRAQELSQDATEAIHNIQALVNGARDLAATVDVQAQKAAAALEAVAARLDAVEGRLESELDETLRELDGLATRAAAVQQDVAGLVETVREALEKLAQERQKSQDTVDASLQETAADAVELTTQMGTTAGGLQEHLDQAAEAVGTLREAIAESRAALERKHGEWEQSLNEMAMTAQSETAFVGQGLTDLLTRQSTTLFELGNYLINAHNEAMELANTKFVDELQGPLDAALETLSRRLEALGELSGMAKDALGREVAALLAKVAAALPGIEQVRAVLAGTSRLG